MRRTAGVVCAATVLGSLWLGGCSDDEAGGASSSGGSGGDSGSSGMAGAMTGGMAGMAGAMTGGMAGMAGSTAATTFTVRVENVSDMSGLPTPFAPGAYAVHATGEPLFTDGAIDRGDGLAALAEDGDPSGLVASLTADAEVVMASAFDTPVGASAPGVATPGGAYEFNVTAEPGQRLSLATMLVHSNDLFVAPMADGLALFDGGGAPASGDVTDQFMLWDTGSERNEAPGMGPTQAPRQSGPDTGPAEGVVSMRVDGTRAIPLPGALVEVTVTEAGGTFTVTIANVSDQGPLATPISPVWYAAHDSSYAVFDADATASAELEALAEDGDPSGLVTQASTAGADAGAAGAAPIVPGSSEQFMVTPTGQNSMLSLATMIVQSNDVVIATPPGGVALLDGGGAVRAAADVQAELRARLANWDAGTEANEVPGAGPNQPLRQAGANTGPADANDTVRHYADSTNDLAAADLANLVAVTITHASGTTFDVTVENQSGAAAYPLLLTPVAWALHDDSAPLLAMGQPASAGLESLAEDGDPTTLLGEWAALGGVMTTGVEGAAPIADGGSFSFQVDAHLIHRFLSLAFMIVPSNDTFVALGTTGVALTDASYAPRPDADIAADVAAALAAYDAGTESNQSGAAGPDMPPVQSGPNTGPAEGSGLVRMVDDIWTYPALGDLVQVTITPQ